MRRIGLILTLFLIAAQLRAADIFINDMYRLVIDADQTYTFYRADDVFQEIYTGKWIESKDTLYCFYTHRTNIVFLEFARIGPNLHRTWADTMLPHRFGSFPNHFHLLQERDSTNRITTQYSVIEERQWKTDRI